VDNKYLVTGDIITLKTGKVEQSIKFFDMDHPTAVKAVKLITSLPEVQYIFTAHFGYSDNYQQAVKDWKE
jgi:hypothetical protein